MFQGFSQQAVDFLWGVRLNNERAWFLEHKQEFLDYVDRPMRELGGQVQNIMAEQYPELGLNLHVARIYRDARRLFGRGPYKDELWFTLRCPREGAESRIPSFYFGLAPELFTYGMGCYDAAPATMAKLRTRMDRDPAPMEHLTRQLQKTAFEIDAPQYKRPKRDPSDLLAPWYNSRSINVRYEDNCEGVLFTPQLAEQIVEGFQQLVPLYRYFSTLPGDPEPK